jgi:beta-lactam-binding protein with PASTA domain
LTLLLLGGLAFGAYRLLAGSGSNEVTVPAVLGATRQAAEQELLDAGLQPAFRNVVGPAGETVGTVIKQTPEQGTEVTAGATVTADINVGPATKRMPKVLVGKQLQVALEKLADAGFTNVISVPVANPPAGTRTDEVLSVDPPEGARAAADQDIRVSYASRTVRAPTRGATQAPGGGGESSRTSETETTDEEQSESPDDDESEEPSGEGSSDEPSVEPSDSSEPEPSASEEPPTSGPSASASSGGGPSAGVPSDPPAGEESPVVVDPADASGAPGLVKKQTEPGPERGG